jgi:hypothetical protein
VQGFIVLLYRPLVGNRKCEVIKSISLKTAAVVGVFTNKIKKENKKYE